VERESAQNGAPSSEDPAWRRYREALEDVAAARKALEARRGATGEDLRLPWERARDSLQLQQLDTLAAIEPLGLGYRVVGSQGVEMTLNRMRDARGDLTAELAVTRHGLHLYQARFNVTSGQARVSTARLLAAHPAGADMGGEVPDWRELLERACVGVLALQRAGTPVETVGDREPSAEPPTVIAPYLPDAASLLWAPQGAGKSTLAAAVVVTLETVAEVIPGWEPRREARCLVLDWEASADEWNDRIRRIAAGAGVEPPLVAYQRCRTALADQVEQLAEVIDRLRIGYLIVDSFEKAAGARSEGSTYEEKAERVFLALDRLARPSLLLDHVSGVDLRHGMGAVTPKSIGSTLKGAWARATYDLKRDPERSTDDRVELLMHNVKINQGRPLLPFEFAMLYEGERGPIRFERSALTSPALMASLPLADRMWRTLAGAGMALPVKDLADELGISQASIRALLSRDAKAASRRFIRLPDNSVALMAQGTSHAG
jgi:hypothetical protein